MEKKNELTLPERAAVALGTPKYEQEIRELVAKTATITEVKNKDGRDQCHGAMMTLKNARVAIEKAAKTAREDATAFSKAVIAEEKRLVALAEPEEARLQGLRDLWDAAVAAEKAAIAAKEKERVDAIRAKIDAIRNTPASLVGKSSADIGVAADHLSETVIALTEFFEFAGECQVERDHAVKKLREMQEAQRAVEAEQVRLAEERAALEAERRAQAERDKQIREARELDERLAREARERAAEKQRAEHEAAEAKLKVERDRIAAEQRAAQERAEAAERAERQATARTQAAMSEIQGIQQQVFIATSGRAGVRKGGTIECIRETLAETEAWQIDAERFGMLAGSAEMAKTTAVAEIRRLLAEAEAREEAEAEERRKREAEAEAARAEAEGIEAEQQRIAAEQAAAEAARQPIAEIHDLFQQQPEVEMVTITKAEYDWLQQRSEWLDCLEAAGVDNWQGFDEAREILREQAA